MKKKIPFILIIIIVSLVGYQSLAYYTTNTTSKNIITTSDIDLSLSVMTLNDEGELESLNTEAIKVMPGDIYSQIPFVTNTGQETFYTRVYLESEIVDEDGEKIDHEGLVFNIDETKWKLDTEGWYRYADTVSFGENTDPLFTTVTIPTDLGNEFTEYSMVIRLQAQCVQSQYNLYQESVLEVQGWPEATVTYTVIGGID
ncbi:MAG: hypothetical protein R3Y57_05470 [Erysipelotrichaceae bacterium]